LAGSGAKSYTELYERYLPQLRAQIFRCDYVSEDSLIDTILSLPPANPFDLEPINVKAELSVVKESYCFPSNVSGYALKCVAGDIFEQYLDNLRVIMTRGYAVGNTREVQNLTIVLHELTEDSIRKIPNVTPELAERYKRDMIYPETTKTTSYTYGQLVNEDKDYIVNLLKFDPTTRRAYQCIFVKDFYNHENPPCAVSIFFRIVDNVLHATVTFRSNDMYKAWPLNALAFRAYQLEIAQTLSIEVGTLTTIAHSAHVYKDDFAECCALLEKHGYTKTNPIPEPEGYYLVAKADDVIGVKLFTNEHQFIKEWRHADPERLIYDVTSHIANPMHAGYLAKEIMEKYLTN
jgi:hypothetical protein